MTTSSKDSFFAIIPGTQEELNTEAKSLIQEMDPNIAHLGEHDLTIISRIKEGKECNRSGVLYLRAVKKRLNKIVEGESDDGDAANDK